MNRSSKAIILSAAAWFCGAAAHADIVPNDAPAIRLSPVSGNPFPTTNQTTVSTLYVNSGYLPLYNNSRWASYFAPALSLTVASDIGNLHDVFEYPSSVPGITALADVPWVTSQTQYTISSITAANPMVVTTSATPTGITTSSIVFIDTNTGTGTVYTDPTYGLNGNFYSVAAVSGSTITLGTIAKVPNGSSLTVSGASGGRITAVPTTRTTAVSYQDGIPVETGAPKYRLIGIYFTGAQGVLGKTEYSSTRRLVWNAADAQNQNLEALTFLGLNSSISGAVAPFSLFGGSNNSSGGTTLPTLQRYDRSAFMGAQNSALRSCPTSGTISGDYYTPGNWVQTGTITATNVHAYFGGTVTFNNSVTCSTECAGGAVNSSSYFQGSPGTGIAGGTSIDENGTQGGGGGGHGGAGGYGGATVAGGSSAGGGTYPLSVGLSGSGGAAGGGNTTTAASNGAGGAGGGSFYIESLGNVTLSSGTAISVNGSSGATSTVTATGSGGGGSGGSFQLMSSGTVTINSGASITANGGAGGAAPTSGAAGGGGGGGYIDISCSGGPANNGTLSATGGAAGTGGTASAGAGSSGVITLNSYIQGPRSTP